MAAVYTIHTYFNAEQIHGVLNSIVMLMGSGGADGDYLGVIRVASIIGLFLAVAWGFVRARGEEAGQYLLMMAIFYSTLFTPRVTVTIEDHGVAAGAPMVVDEVPIGLAFFASTTSHIGYWLTERSETFFSLPDTSLKLGQSGLMGAARALREAQSAVVPDPVLAQDLINFMRDCVNPELLTSTANVVALMEATDIWTALGAAGLDLINPGRMATLVGYPTAVGCSDAYTSLGARLPPAAAVEFDRIARLLNPGATPMTANNILTSMLPVAEGMIMTASASTTDAIKQRMLINVLNDTSATMGQILNDPSAAQVAVGHAMASSSANSTYQMMARLARESLPIVHNAIELVILGVFPIILLLVVIAGAKGGTVLRTYVLTMLWVQLWAPLYAIVNYVATMSSAKSMHAALAGVDGVSIRNAAQLLNTTISAEAVAGILTIGVPLIAYALVKGGEVAMASIASSMTGPADRAAQKSGEQVGHGNISAGNLSWGTVSTNNSSSNQHNAGLTIKTPQAGALQDGWGRTDLNGDPRARGTGLETLSTPTLGNSGIGVAATQQLAASSTDRSGRAAELADGMTRTRGLGVGASFSEADMATAAANVSKAATRLWGGSTGFSVADGSTSGTSVGDGTGLTFGVSQADKLAVGGGMRAGGRQSDQVSEKVADTDEALRQAQGGAGRGAQKPEGWRSIVANVASAIDRAASYGFSTESTVGAQATGTDEARTGKQQAVEKAFRQLADAVLSNTASDATSGTRAAAAQMLGQVSERLDATAGTNTSSVLKAYAGTEVSRSSSSSVGSNMNLEAQSQKALKTAADEMGIAHGDINYALATNPAFRARAAQLAGEGAAAEHLPAGGAVRGLDGNGIEAPSSSPDELKARGDRAVTDQHLHDRALARSEGAAFRARPVAYAAAAGVPAAGAEPDTSAASGAYHDTKGRAVAGQQQTLGEVAVERISTRLAAAADQQIAKDSPMSRAFSNALLGGKLDASRTGMELRGEIKSLYQSNAPGVRALYADIANSDRPVTEQDLEVLAKAKNR